MCDDPAWRAVTIQSLTWVHRGLECGDPVYPLSFVNWCGQTKTWFEDLVFQQTVWRGEINLLRQNSHVQERPASVETSQPYMRFYSFQSESRFWHFRQCCSRRNLMQLVKSLFKRFYELRSPRLNLGIVKGSCDETPVAGQGTDEGRPSGPITHCARVAALPD